MELAVISETRLEKFRGWLRDNGRSEGTAELYVYNVRACAREKTLTQRLTSDGLSPHTLHTNKAALRAWADFSDDAPLALRLNKIKLPPAERLRPKRELDEGDWKLLVKSLECLPAIVRAILLVMNRRGLRTGDVLRLKKTEIRAALRTGTMSYEGKGRRRHEYSVEPIRAAFEVFSAQKGPWERVEDLITHSQKDGMGKRRAASKVISRALKRCAKASRLEDVHPHRLRRTYATHFLRRLRGDPQALVKLQRHMGWKNMTTALQYVDAVDRGELDAIGAQMVEALDA